MREKSRGTALVTGGANRIGKGIALYLASSGYKVALHYNLSEKAALRVARQINENSGNCEVFRCDFNDEKQTINLIGQVLSKFDDLNLLINNASIFEKSDLKMKDMALFNRQMAINFKAPYILTGVFARHCKVGQIVNILDTNIVKNRTSYSAYLLSKKSLAELTKISAVELAPKVRVNAVAPGLILPPAGEKDSYLKRLAKQIPLKKKGSVAAVTEAIGFLVNNEYQTGQIIYLDGGEHLI